MTKYYNSAEQAVKESIKSLFDEESLDSGGRLFPLSRQAFLEEMVIKSKLLQYARKEDMGSDIKQIPRIAFNDDFFTSAKDDNGNNIVLDPSQHGASPTTNQNELRARKIVGIVPIHDDSLDLNIEGDRLKERIKNMITKGAARQFAAMCLLGDTDRPYASGSILHLTNGYLKTAKNKVNAADLEKASAKIEKGLLALPDQYREMNEDMVALAGFELFNEYHNELAERGTQLGDRSTTGTPELYYKGIKVIYEPLMDHKSVRKENGGPGKSLLITHRDNLVYGVFKDLLIIEDRDNKGFSTNIIISMQGDASYENENGAVLVELEESGD